MVSNRTLALFIIATVIVSLGGTLLSLSKLDELRTLKVAPAEPVTGLASGIVSLTINQSADCVVNNNITFGAGAQPAFTNILSTDLINTDGFNDCVAFGNCTGMHLNNTGNVNLNVSFLSDVDATGFLVSQSGLGADDFLFYIRNGTYTNATQGCRNITNYGGNVPTTETLICQNLTYIDTNDILTMEFNVTIQPDIVPGAKLATITINCAQN